MLYRIKQWIIGRDFVQSYIDGLQRSWTVDASMDAFKKAREDLKETNVYETDKKAEELMTNRLNELLSNVDLTKIVAQDPRGFIVIGGKHAENGRLTNLKAEAEFLVQSDLWGLLYETPKELAQRAMFVESQSLDDLKKGKSILYTLSTQTKILDTLKAYVPK